MIEKRLLLTVFYMYLIVSPPYIMGFVPKDTVLNVFVGAFFATMQEARNTRNLNPFDRAAQLAWQRSNTAYMAKTVAHFLELALYGHGQVADFEFYDAKMNATLQDYMNTSVDDLTSVQERKEWALIMTTMSLVFEKVEELHHMHESSRRSARNAGFGSDGLTSITPELTREFEKIMDLAELFKISAEIHDPSATAEQRRMMESVVAALNTAVINIGGIQGFILIIARTTLYNFVMPYIYATYQLYFQHSEARVNAWRKNQMGMLVCRRAIAQGRGSHPGNSGCRALLKGEEMLSLESPRKRNQFVDAAPIDAGMPFDVKAVVDYLKKWTEDPSLRIEAMDTKAIRDLHEQFTYVHLFSSKFMLAYKKELVRYCHFAAAADSRRNVASTCPLGNGDANRVGSG